jgi:hypothetical protein
VKLRAFQTQAGDFEKIAMMLQKILWKESELGAKLLELNQTKDVRSGIEQANRLIIEKEVLLDYHEEMKHNPVNDGDENVKVKREKIERKRLELMPVDKLHVAYLV